MRHHSTGLTPANRWLHNIKELKECYTRSTQNQAGWTRLHRARLFSFRGFMFLHSNDCAAPNDQDNPPFYLTIRDLARSRARFARPVASWNLFSASFSRALSPFAVTFLYYHPTASWDRFLPEKLPSSLCGLQNLTGSLSSMETKSFRYRFLRFSGHTGVSGGLTTCSPPFNPVCGSP